MPQIDDQELGRIQDLKVSESWAKLQLVRLEQITDAASRLLALRAGQVLGPELRGYVTSILRSTADALRRGDGAELEAITTAVTRRIADLERPRPPEQTDHGSCPECGAKLPEPGVVCS